MKCDKNALLSKHRGHKKGEERENDKKMISNFFKETSKTLKLLYLSIWIDSKSIVWDSPYSIHWQLWLASSRPN